jgi:predicted Zn-dependent peptidase
MYTSWRRQQFTFISCHTRKIGNNLPDYILSKLIHQDVSSFGVYYSTNEKQSDKVLEIVLREFKKLKEKKVSDKELNKVKSYIKGGTLLSLESTTNRMMRIANSMLYFNRIVPVEEYLKKIENINADQIFDLANEILDEDKLIKVILKSNQNRMPNVA